MFSLRLPWSYWTGIVENSKHSWHFSKLLNIYRVNSLRPRQDCRHFQDGIFKYVFLNEYVKSSNNVSLFVPKGPIDNIPALVQIMAWRRPGDKPLSEPMMVRLQTHICVTRPQWVNESNIPLSALQVPGNICLENVCYSFSPEFSQTSTYCRT